VAVEAAGIRVAVLRAVPRAAAARAVVVVPSVKAAESAVPSHAATTEMATATAEAVDKRQHSPSRVRRKVLVAPVGVRRLVSVNRLRSLSRRLPLVRPSLAECLMRQPT
jgi:hypothetical protein